MINRYLKNISILFLSFLIVISGCSTPTTTPTVKPSFDNNKFIKDITALNKSTISFLNSKSFKTKSLYDYFSTQTTASLPYSNKVKVDYFVTYWLPEGGSVECKYDSKESITLLNNSVSFQYNNNESKWFVYYNGNTHTLPKNGGSFSSSDYSGSLSVSDQDITIQITRKTETKNWNVNGSMGGDYLSDVCPRPEGVFRFYLCTDTTTINDYSFEKVFNLNPQPTPTPEPTVTPSPSPLPTPTITPIPVPTCNNDIHCIPCPPLMTCTGPGPSPSIPPSPTPQSSSSPSNNPSNPPSPTSYPSPSNTPFPNPTPYPNPSKTPKPLKNCNNSPIINTDKNIFTPNDDGKKDTLGINIRACGNWNLKIEPTNINQVNIPNFDKNNLTKQFSGTDEKQIIWDGKNNLGEILHTKYKLTITGEDGKTAIDYVEIAKPKEFESEAYTGLISYNTEHPFRITSANDNNAIGACGGKISLVWTNWVYPKWMLIAPSLAVSYYGVITKAEFTGTVLDSLGNTVYTWDQNGERQLLGCLPDGGCQADMGTEEINSTKSGFDISSAYITVKTWSGRANKGKDKGKILPTGKYSYSVVGKVTYVGLSTNNTRSFNKGVNYINITKDKNNRNYDVPSDRHYLNRINKKVTDINSIFSLAKTKNEVLQIISVDMKEINECKINNVNNTFTTSSGRIYGYKNSENGGRGEQVYPISGTGIEELNRVEYTMLYQFKTNGIEAYKFAQVQISKGILQPQELYRVEIIARFAGFI